MFVVGAYLLATLPDDSPIPTAVGPLLGVRWDCRSSCTWRCDAWRRRPTACCCRWRPCSAGSATCSSSASTRPRPAGRPGRPQSLWMILGAAAFVATLMVVLDARKLERYRTAGFVGLVLLLLPLVPVIGRTINGSRIWVSFGPINFQPGEFAKLAWPVLRRLPDRESASCWPSTGPSGRSPCPTPSTSARCSSPGASPWSSWSWSGTSARRCCSSRCSWC